MASNRCPSADLRGLLLVGWLLLSSSSASGAELRDAPIRWWDDDRHHVANEILEREIPIGWDAYTDTVVRPLGRATRPGRLARKIGTLFGGDRVPSAENVNRLDEVVNSSWFTNRIGLFAMSPQEIARGPVVAGGPDTSRPWHVIRAKTEGVTPGFTIRDAQNTTWIIKFDPPGYPGMTLAAGVISNRILHAAGYNVPEDAPVSFTREQLILDSGILFEPVPGLEREMTVADLDSLLGGVARSPDGRWRALASKYLEGVPKGPFDYKGRREDDPNDHIDHENRRELRGLYLFASWLGHYDTKQHNSLDMLVEEDGRSFLKHHLIDFASTIGAGARRPTLRYGYEYTVDVPSILGRLVSVGVHEDGWRTMTRDESMVEVGYWEDEVWSPFGFEPLTPNTAFANITPRDNYWAAKIITAFGDAELEAVVEEAGYQDPRAHAHVLKVLRNRRDRIGRVVFSRTTPLDFFVWEEVANRIVFADLAQQRGTFPGTHPRYRCRIRAVDEDRHGSDAPWRELGATRIELSPELLAEARSPGRGFLEAELQVDRGEGWSDPVKVWFAAASRRCVGVER